jgi:hypothetical protein
MAAFRIIASFALAPLVACGGERPRDTTPVAETRPVATAAPVASAPPASSAPAPVAWAPAPDPAPVASAPAPDPAPAAWAPAPAPGPLATSVPATRVEGKILWRTRGAIGGVLVDADAVYVEAGCIVRWDKRTHSVSTLDGCQLPGPSFGHLSKWRLAQSATTIFVALEGEKGATIRSLPKNGGPGATIAAATGRGPYALATDATHLYWLELDHVKRVPLAGGPAEDFAPGDGGGSLALTDRHVVFSMMNYQRKRTVARPKAGGAEIMLAPDHDADELTSEGDTVIGIAKWSSLVRYAVGARPDVLLQELRGARAVAVHGGRAYVASACYGVEPPLYVVDLATRAVSRHPGPRCTIGAAADDDGLYVSSLDEVDCSALNRAAAEGGAAILGTCDPKTSTLRRYPR